MSIPVMREGKFCANCVYWCGDRILEGFFHRVSIKDGHEEGVCSCMKGRYNCTVPWNGQCPAFERHPVTK